MSNPLILPLELGSILDDMNNCIIARLYYPALLVALTLPEICSAMQLPNTTMIRDKHYIPFVDKYTTPADLGIDGLDCYRMRGGLIHRASLARHPSADFTHVIFTIPETKNLSMHAFSIEAGDKSAVMLDLISFCRTMEIAVRRWFFDHKDNALGPRPIK